MMENFMSVGPLVDFQLTVYYTCIVVWKQFTSIQMYRIFVGSQVKYMLDIYFLHLPCQKFQLTLSNICTSVLVIYQHDDLFGAFVILGNVLLFPTHLNVYQSFNFRNIKNLFTVSARFSEINLFCKYFKFILCKSKQLCTFHIIKILTKYHSQPTFLIRISAVFCELVLAALCRGVVPHVIFRFRQPWHFF